MNRKIKGMAIATVVGLAVAWYVNANWFTTVLALTVGWFMILAYFFVTASPKTNKEEQ